jgi:hypothetical protein
LLMIAKGYMPLSIVESPCLRQTVSLWSNVVFISQVACLWNIFLLYYKKPWKCMCFLPLVLMQLWQQLLTWECPMYTFILVINFID